MSHQLFKRIFHSLNGTRGNRVLTRFVKFGDWCRRVQLSSPAAGMRRFLAERKHVRVAHRKRGAQFQMVRTLRVGSQKRESKIMRDPNYSGIRLSGLKAATKSMCHSSDVRGDRNLDANRRIVRLNGSGRTWTPIIGDKLA